MDDLVAFLRARYDEDERTAHAVMWDGSGNRLSWELPASATVDVGEDEFYAGDRTVADHIARHDPARVLREVEAKRQILHLHRPVQRRSTGSGGGMFEACGICDHFPAQHPCLTLRLLALPYDTHPNYQEAWRP